MQTAKLNSCRREIAAIALSAMVLVSTALSVVHAAPATAADRAEFFESKVRPLLADHCQKCHGPKKQWSGLRLDSLESALAGGDSGPAIVASQPDESELVKRITSDDDDFRMPPPKEGPPLNAEQIAAIEYWIKIGAPWPTSAKHAQNMREGQKREHWAFQPIKRIEPPKVESPARVFNPVDQFVVQSLKANGLQLSPEADRRTLIRRATYDLLGLPPTSEEVNAFVNETAPDAYEHLIERLLASPRYGEHWGRHWLDVARYSDTKGYVYGREERRFVHSSLYRDWVIQAFNDDLPFDRFVLLQLAADQVAPEDPNALRALGFLTLGRRFLGVTPDIIDDRIDVVSRGLLGLTVGCARCHDHKYDPIPTADYYSLYGVFQNCAEREVEIPRPPGTPPLTADFAKELQDRRQKLQELTTTLRTEASNKIRARLKDYLLSQRELNKYPELAFSQIVGDNDLVPGVVHRWQSLLAVAEKNSDPVFTPWIDYNRLSDDEFSAKSAEITQALQTDLSKLNPRVADAFIHPPSSAAEVAERYATLLAKVDEQWKAICERGERDNQPTPQALPDAADEQLRLAFYGPRSPCVIPDESIDDTEPLWNFAMMEKLRKVQTEYDQWLLKAPVSSPCVVVLNDRPYPIDPQIFRRGNPASKGDVVPRQLPQVIAGPNRQPFSRGSGRLELAKAIIDPANPLTARVWVNRVWLHHFGGGLVTTPSDFGARATPPSHPELLDWLASELVQNGWSTKSLHRTIMLSATYRQTSSGPTNVAERMAAQERDPENRLLWRTNPRRLSFEQFRDSLIAISNEIDLTMGGRGTDLFGFRRSVYVTIDRQFLPTLLSVFDFANPNLHSPGRTESSIPQQALFVMNHPYMAGRAKQIVHRIAGESNNSSTDRVKRAYQAVLQREPMPEELQAANQFLADAEQHAVSTTLVTNKSDWTYGFGEMDELSGRLKAFQPLPYFSGTAWQGGSEWPDATLGWMQLTAQGGHTGDDHQHAVVRRWTATTAGTVSIASEMSHSFAEGDGVRAWIVSSRQGVLKSAAVHNRKVGVDVEALNVDPGDTIDFVVDLAGSAINNQFTWAAKITQAVSAGAASPNATRSWNAEQDFVGPPGQMLTPLEQFVQVLLMSNEFMFVD
jgi:hypothetical protein